MVSEGSQSLMSDIYLDTEEVGGGHTQGSLSSPLRLCDDSKSYNLQPRIQDIIIF